MTNQLIKHTHDSPKRFNVAKLFFLFLVLTLAQSDVSAQCAVCNKALEENLKNDPNAVGSGINTGIMYMLVVVYLLLMGILVMFFKQQLRERWERIKKSWKSHRKRKLST